MATSGPRFYDDERFADGETYARRMRIPLFLLFAAGR